MLKDYEKLNILTQCVSKYTDKPTYFKIMKEYAKRAKKAEEERKKEQ